MRALFAVLIVVLIAAAIWWLLDTGDARIDDPIGTDASPDERPTAGLEGAVGQTPESALGASALPARGAAEVRGHVEDLSGAPLAGVPIEFWFLLPGTFLEQNAGAWLEPDRIGRSEPSVLAATTRSDARGDFVVAGLARGSYQVVAVPDPPWCANSGWAEAGSAFSETVRLVLGTGKPIHLRVVDATGAGLVATVSAYREKDGPDTAWFPWSLFDRTTGADGRVAFATPAGTLRVSVFVKGVGRRTGIPVRAPHDGEVVLALDADDAATLVGRVTDTGGRPVPGATVVAQTRRGTWSGERSERGARTGEDGTYRITGLAPGILDGLAAAAPGFLPVEGVAPSQPVSAGGETRVDVTLVRGGVIEGTVTGPAGEPVAGAEILASVDRARHGQVSYDKAVSDANGRYRLARVPLGHGTLSVSARGYYQRRPDGAQVAEQFDLTSEGASQTIDVVLERGTPVTGRVVDAQGTPVVGAEVELSGRNKEGAWNGDDEDRRRVTDSRGAFRYEGLPPSPEWTLSARFGEALSEPADVETAAGERPPGPVELVLRPGAVLAGRVVVAGRPPKTSLRVTVRADDRPIRTEAVLSDGTFRIDGLRPASVELYAIDRESRSVSEILRQDLDWGTVFDGLVIEARPLGSIAGVVVDPDGNPVADVRLLLRIETTGSTSSRAAQTTASGRFEFPSLEETGFTYVLLLDGEQVGVFRPGDHDLRLVHAGFQTEVFEGRVRMPDGTPVVAGRVTIYEVAQGTHEGSSGSILAGRFQLRLQRRSADSTFELRVTDVADQLGQPANVRPVPAMPIAPGTPIEIDLEAGVEIAGRVVGDAGPVAGIRVFVRPNGTSPSGFSGDMTTTRTDGAFRFPALAPGDYLLGVQPGVEWVRPVETAARGGDTDVVIRLERGVAIRGRVVDPAGDPVPGAMLQFGWPLEQPDGGRQTAYASGTSAEGGRFEIEGVPPGVTGTLTAQPPRGSDAGLMFATLPDVAADGKDVVVTLPAGVMITGTITGPRGQPLSRATVMAEPLDPGPSRGLWYSDVESGETEFVVGPMSPGRYRLRFGVGSEFLAPEPVEVSAPAAGLRVFARDGHKLFGRVEGGVDRQRMALYFVTMENGHSKAVGVPIVSTGEFELVLEDDSGGALFLQEREGTRYALAEDVRPSGSPIVLRVVEGETITGRIEGYAGPGDAGYVYAQSPSGVTVNAKVAEDGTWVMQAVPPGEYDVRGFSAGGWLEPVLGVSAGTRDVVLSKKK